MQSELTTGVLELGVPGKDVPFIYISPLPLRLGVVAGQDLMDMAVRAVQEDTTEWMLGKGKLDITASWLPPQAVALARKSLRMLSGSGDLLILFCFGSMDPLDALYEIEQSEGDNLHPALAGGILAALRAKTLPCPPVYYVAEICAAKQPASQANNGATRAEFMRLNRHDLNKMVDAYLAALAQGREETTRVPAGAVNRARFWLLAMQKLWDPEVQGVFARNHMAIPFDVKDTIITMAATALALQNRWSVFLPYRKTPLQVSDWMSAWPQIMEWTLHNISHGALHFLAGDRMPNGDPTVNRFLPPAKDTWITPPLCQGLTAALLEEAERDAAFVPNGAFLLELPDDHPLQKTRVKLLRVWAEPDGLWIGLVGGQGHVSEIMYWAPGQPLNGWIVEFWSRPLLEVTLAALWRDLRVAGQEALPEADAIPSVQRTTHPHNKNRHGKKRNSIRTLPTPTRPGLTGTRSWGNAREQDAIRRRAHGVRGHLRQLKSNQKASDQARKLAAEFGVVVPADRTFVRPHLRGSESSQENGPSQPNSVIRARGLASVMTFLGQ